MPYDNLKTKELISYNRSAAEYFFKLIEKYWKRKLTKDEINKIVEKNSILIWGGNTPYGNGKLNYVVYMVKISTDFPLKITLNCEFSTENHKGIIPKIGADRVIVGGSISEGRFHEYSDTWTTMVGYNSPAYFFGKAINKIMLKIHNLQE